MNLIRAHSQTSMHVTMLRLCFAYAIFTAPRVFAHMFYKKLGMTPFKVICSEVFEIQFHTEKQLGKIEFVTHIFSVNDTLLLVLLDVLNQRHHLRGLFKRIQKSLQNILWRCFSWICKSLEKMLVPENIWDRNFCNWTVYKKRQPPRALLLICMLELIVPI